jgi:chemotaxis regulatin CheY-phosphate phosphatase CheZ
MLEQQGITITPNNVDSVIVALQRVIALLDRIKLSIEESSGKIPKASVQLDNVTQATETATIEILNVLDTLSQNIDNVKVGVGHFNALPLSSDDKKTLEHIGLSIEAAQENAMNISIALQVQDITAQKIAAANHLIETVRVELLQELDYFSSSSEKVRASDLTTLKPASSFDKDAAFNKHVDHQQLIDRVVSNWKEQQPIK